MSFYQHLKQQEIPKTEAIVFSACFAAAGALHPGVILGIPLALVFEYVLYVKNEKSTEE